MKAKLLVLVLSALVMLAAVTFLAPEAETGWTQGHLYVIGTGPAGPETATLQALNAIKQMDAIIAPPEQVKLFRDYIGDKKSLFDPWGGLWDYKGKPSKNLSLQERNKFEKERDKMVEDRVSQVKRLLSEGKDVGVLDYGNPCLFGPSHWYKEYFDDAEVVIIPGMGCDAAAMAALGKSTIPAYNVQFVLQSAPFFLVDENQKDLEILRDLAKYPITMILYMALENPEKLFAKMQKFFPADMPCAVVFWAGYPDKQRIVKGTIADMGQKLAKEKEKFMGLLFIGRFLEGDPYLSAVYNKQASQD